MIRLLLTEKTAREMRAALASLKPYDNLTILPEWSDVEGTEVINGERGTVEIVLGDEWRVSLVVNRA